MELLSSSEVKAALEKGDEMANEKASKNRCLFDGERSIKNGTSQSVLDELVAEAAAYQG